MTTNRKTAIAVGVLFIISTVSGFLNVGFLGDMLTEPDYLVNIAANETRMILGALFDLLCAGAFVGVAVMLFPVLKQHSEHTAVGYVVARSFEAVPFVISVISLLSLLTLSQEFVQDGAPDASSFQATGAALSAMRDWAFLFGPVIFFSLTALILNASLYQSQLVPRLISVWGLIGATLFLAAGLLAMFGPNLIMYFTVLIAPQEMVFAGWLIIKGFNPAALASESA